MGKIWLVRVNWSEAPGKERPFLILYPNENKTKLCTDEPVPPLIKIEDFF